MTAAVKPLPDHGTTRPEPMVDVEPVREHLRSLMAHRVGYRLAAELSGVPVKTVKSILYGHYDGTPLKQVQARTARKILAVQVPAPLNAPDHKKVDATVTRRQMRALACRGHSLTLIADTIGTAPKVVRGWVHNDLIEARWARAVANLYERWHNADAEQHGATPTSAAQTRAWALRANYVPTEAWRDIHDPDEAQPGSYMPDLRTPAEIVEDAEFIRATTGQSWDLIAERIGVPPSTLRQYRNRIARAGGGAS